MAEAAYFAILVVIWPVRPVAIRFARRGGRERPDRAETD
jgi:hypothetical protein